MANSQTYHTRLAQHWCQQLRELESPQEYNRLKCAQLPLGKPPTSNQQHGSVNLQHWTLSRMVLTRQPWAAHLVLSPKERLGPDTASPSRSSQAAHRGAAPEGVQCPKSRPGSTRGWLAFLPPSPCAATTARFQVSGGNFYFLAATSWPKSAFPNVLDFPGKKPPAARSRGHAFRRGCAQTRALHRCVRIDEHRASLSAVKQSLIYIEYVQKNQWQKTRSVL